MQEIIKIENVKPFKHKNKTKKKSCVLTAWFKIPGCHRQTYHKQLQLTTDPQPTQIEGTLLQNERLPILTRDKNKACIYILVFVFLIRSPYIPPHYVLRVYKRFMQKMMCQYNDDAPTSVCSCVRCKFMILKKQISKQPIFTLIWTDCFNNDRRPDGRSLFCWITYRYPVTVKINKHVFANNADRKIKIPPVNAQWVVGTCNNARVFTY